MCPFKKKLLKSNALFFIFFGGITLGPFLLGPFHEDLHQRRTQGGGNGAMAPTIRPKGGQHVFWPPKRQLDPFSKADPLGPPCPFWF